MSTELRKNNRIRRLHKQMFDTTPECIAMAPGRIVLLGDGEYSDDGLSLGCAVAKYAMITVSRRTDRRLVAYSEWARQTIRISPRPPVPTGQGFWGDYVVGVWTSLAAGRVEDRGVSLVIGGNLPPGIGLGSSGALEIALSLALRELWALDIDDRDLAMMAHRSENLFVGVRTGLVDQLVSISARDQKIIHLDCNTLEMDFFDAPDSASLVACDSGVHRTLAQAPFNQRRRELDEALLFFRNRYPGLTGFRQVRAEMLVQAAQDLSPVALKRARHVVTENDRVRRATIALRWGDVETLGSLMLSSYRSAKDAFESSTPALDELIELSRTAEGLFGARLSGPGFGGCTVHLVDRNTSDALVKTLQKKYNTPAMKPPQVFTLTPVTGATAMRLKKR